MSELNEAARSLGRKGGKSRSAEKQQASRDNGKLGGRPAANQFTHAVVVEYDCGLGERGTTVSKHKTYELARAAARRSGFDSFLAIRPIE